MCKGLHFCKLLLIIPKTYTAFSTSLLLSEMLGGGGLVAKSRLTLVTPWTVACRAPLSKGFSRQNTGVGCHFLPQGIFLTCTCLLYISSLHSTFKE